MPVDNRSSFLATAAVCFLSAFSVGCGGADASAVENVAAMEQAACGSGTTPCGTLCCNNSTSQCWSSPTSYACIQNGYFGCYGSSGTLKACNSSTQLCKEYPAGSGSVVCSTPIGCTNPAPGSGPAGVECGDLCCVGGCDASGEACATASYPQLGSN
jgi:hypothetical protein